MLAEGFETSSNGSKTLIFELSLFINVNFSIFFMQKLYENYLFFRELCAIIQNMAFLNGIWFY